jgi:DNA-binding LytR/AlgR family response regulator
MKIVILEDEKLSAEHLQTMLKRIEPSIEVLEVFDSVKKSVEYFKKNNDANLLFVDIHLADGISFELFSKVKIEVPIIFTTAYDEYAIKAFKLNSVDYLLKPIDIEELKVAIEKFKKGVQTKQSIIAEDISAIIQNVHKQYKNRFMVKIGDTISSLKTEDINYFLSEDGLVLAITSQNKKYPIDYTLDQLEDIVSPELFFRINRKVLVNINSVQKASAYFNSRLKLTIIGLSEEDAVVSRERVADFKKWLDN